MNIEYFKLLLDEIIKFNNGDAQLFFPVIVNKPQGKNQDESGEYFKAHWVDQSGSEDYGYYGTEYFQIDNDNWLAVRFTC